MSASLVPGIVIMSDVAPLGTESYWALSTSTHTHTHSTLYFPTVSRNNEQNLCSPGSLHL